MHTNQVNPVHSSQALLGCLNAHKSLWHDWLMETTCFPNRAALSSCSNISGARMHAHTDPADHVDGSETLIQLSIGAGNHTHTHTHIYAVYEITCKELLVVLHPCSIHTHWYCYVHIGTHIHRLSYTSAYTPSHCYDPLLPLCPCCVSAISFKPTCGGAFEESDSILSLSLSRHPL